MLLPISATPRCFDAAVPPRPRFRASRRAASTRWRPTARVAGSSAVSTWRSRARPYPGLIHVLFERFARSGGAVVRGRGLLCPRFRLNALRGRHFFDEMGGAARQNPRRSTSPTLTRNGLDPGPDGAVKAMALSASTPTWAACRQRRGRRAQERRRDRHRDGAATAGSPRRTPKCARSLVNGSIVYLGGSFRARRDGAATSPRWTRRPARFASWAPEANSRVRVALNGTTNLAGGSSTIGGRPAPASRRSASTTASRDDVEPGTAGGGVNTRFSASGIGVHGGAFGPPWAAARPISRPWTRRPVSRRSRRTGPNNVVSTPSRAVASHRRRRAVLPDDVTRNRIAAINLTTGAPTAFNPTRRTSCTRCCSTVPRSTPVERSRRSAADAQPSRGAEHGDRPGDGLEPEHQQPSVRSRSSARTSTPEASSRPSARWRGPTSRKSTRRPASRPASRPIRTTSSTRAARGRQHATPAGSS